MYVYNYIINKFDKQPKELVRTSQEFGAAMVSRAVKKKSDVPLFIPAVMDGMGRKNKNVKSITMIVVDIDSKLKHLSFPTMNRIHPDFEGYTFFCYSTFSSSKNHPKWRMIIPLTEPISVDIWCQGGWEAAMEIFGRFLCVPWKDFCDFSCRNPARAYYYPSHHIDQPEQQKSLWNFGKILPTEEVIKRIVKPKPRKKPEPFRIMYQPRRGLDSEIAKIKELRIPENRKRFCKELGIETKMIKSNNGEINETAFGFPCPNCGRTDATFFYIDGFNAHCNHLESCGWTDNLYNLGKHMGKR